MSRTEAVCIETSSQGKRWLILGLIAGVVVTLWVWSEHRSSVYYDGTATSEIRQARLLNEIQEGNKQELAKLLYVMEIYRNKDVKIIFDGIEYDINHALTEAQRLITHYYKGQPAGDFVQTHLYRTPFQDQIIYMIMADGMRRPLRDVFLEELQNLPISA